MSTGEKKEFPDGMVPLGNSTFKFACHSGVTCFTHCCRKLELFLYPYDIIRLKQKLGITSEEFLDKYAGVAQGANPYFPAVILRMLDNQEHTCPFLDKIGCRVYEDRPSACRTYPLERAVDRSASSGQRDEFYFMTDHPYCKGHGEERQWTVKEWLQDQHLLYYNMMDDLWAEMDTIFSKNPWGDEGAAGPRQRMAFMVCYNLDAFRVYAQEHQLFNAFKLSKSEVREMEKDDEALLRFGFKWLQYMLTGAPTLKPRK